MHLGVGFGPGNYKACLWAFKTHTVPSLIVDARQFSGEGSGSSPPTIDDRANFQGRISGTVAFGTAGNRALCIILYLRPLIRSFMSESGLNLWFGMRKVRTLNVELDLLGSSNGCNDSSSSAFSLRLSTAAAAPPLPARAQLLPAAFFR